MYSDEASCSDCKLELIENKWYQLLLKWLNKCVNSKVKVRELNTKSLVDVINKYKHDICANDIDRAILCTDDIEPFIRYKYPILRLRYFSEEKDIPMKLFIMTSMLLFHCCTKSQIGAVDEDICNQLSKREQMFILKFCERLNEMEATVNNVKCAIRDAYEIASKLEDVCYKSSSLLESETDRGKSSSDTDAYISSESAIKASLATLQSNNTIESNSLESDKIPVENLISSMSGIPSLISNTSTLSDFISGHSYISNYGSEIDIIDIEDTDEYIDSTEINTYKLESSASAEKKSKILKKKQFFKGNVTQKKNAPPKAVPQIKSYEQNTGGNQNEGRIEIERKVQKQYADECQTDAENSNTAKLQDKKQQEEAAAADLSQTVKEQKVMSSGDLGQHVTYQKVTATTVLNQVVTHRKGDADIVVSQRVTQRKQDETSYPKIQMATQKCFAQKATVTHKEGDVQADSKEIKHPATEETVDSQCITSSACCGDFGRTKGISVLNPLPDKMLSKPPQSSPVWPYPVQEASIWPSTGQSPPDHTVTIDQPSRGQAIIENSVPEQPLSEESSSEDSNPKDLYGAEGIIKHPNTWECINRLCRRVYGPTKARMFTSFSRCTLLCMGPQLWPYPVGYTFFSDKIVFISTNKLEYKFEMVPSETLHPYLAEAFKLFLGDLAKLEKDNVKYKERTNNLAVKKMYINIDVEIDPDPRLRLNTEESYSLKVETINDEVVIKVASASFCGVRHGLETLTQLILLDKTTGYLVTLSNTVIKDTPSYKYRGLMLDTARNYIPVSDILRTVDAMATCKLNTFHWRISDVTSFPLLLPQLPQLFEYGAYDRSMVYTKADVISIVERAGIRGIRVLIEVAAPGPVGRAWSWTPDANCPTKTDNYTCANVLCQRINMQDTVLDVLQIIYSEILEMTKVDDVFHLSDSVFSLSNCFFLIEEREGFLAKALARLKLANKGKLPKLPIIWYTSHLTNDYEAKTWDRLGVQLSDWHPNPAGPFLSKFKVIHSSKWDLSCEMKKQRCHKYRTWQEMYSWKSWRNIEVFTIEGGESILWTDLVNSGNLDYHLWPRAAAVAERLWSDVIANTSASGSVYVRLDSHRWRMLLHGVKVQPVWPQWCSFNPASCLQKL